MKKITKNEDFIFEIIHDIKSPIISIDFALKNAKRDSFLDEIYKINKFNLDYIENMLLKYSFDRGKYCIKPEVINIGEIVEEEIRALSFLICEKKLRIILSFDKSDNNYILSDKYLVSQIVLNLLSNAIKYAPEDTAVEIVFEKKDGCLNVCFKNIFNKDIKSCHSNKMGLDIIKRKLKSIRGRFKITKNKNMICFNVCFEN